MAENVDPCAIGSPNSRGSARLLPLIMFLSRASSLFCSEVAAAPPAKIVNYHVVRNDANFTTFMVQPRVLSKDVGKLDYYTDDAGTEVYVEDHCLMFTGKQKAEHTTARAFLKLSKNHQPVIADIDKPPRGGLFVTVLKVGATVDKPPPLDETLTGRAKHRIIGPDGNDMPTSQGGLPGFPDPDGVVREWFKPDEAKKAAKK